MFGISPFKKLSKQLNSLYKIKHEIESRSEVLSAADNRELDAVTAEIEALIEGDYAESVFNYYSKKTPKLIRLRTDEIVRWEDAFGTSYKSVTKSQKHSLVGLIEGGGKYRLK